MLINGRTPAQIKAGLRCGKGDVQPKCVDCAYLGYYDEDFEVQHFDCGEIDNDALAYIEQLEVALKCEQVARTVLMEDMPKWISVKERLPPPETKIYLIASFSPDGEQIVKTSVWAWDEIGEKGDWINWNVVTHWMPLPEPPEDT